MPEPASSPESLQAAFTTEWALDRSSAVPAYEQIAERLLALIEAGRLGVGDRVAPERDLAGWLGVSRMTARAALSALAQRGLLERDVGRGTFVARAKLEHDLERFAGFTETLRRQGHTALARIRALNELVAPETVARELELAASQTAYRIERVRLVDGEPVALEDSWIPAARFPGLLEHDLRGSLYGVMRDRYRLAPVRARERLEPVAAGPEQARELGTLAGAPLMLITRVAYSADGLPVEFARDHHRGDRTTFVVETRTALDDPA